MPRQVAILTSDATVAAEAKTKLPGTAVNWLADFCTDLYSQQRNAYLKQLIETMKGMRADGLSINAHAAIDKGFAGTLRRNNIELHGWDVDDLVTTAHLWHVGANSLTTDHPGWFRMLHLRKVASFLTHSIYNLTLLASR